MLTKEHADKLADLIVEQSGELCEIWITTALELYKKGYYDGAADAFGKAKGTFDEGTSEYELINAWESEATGLIGTSADTDQALVSVSDDVEDSEVDDEAEEYDEVYEAPIEYDNVLKSMMISKVDASEAAQELAGILSTYEGEYAGNYIAIALDFYEKGLFEDAAENFEKARNAFMPEDNQEEWSLLDKWANDAYARSLAVTDVETGSDEIDAGEDTSEETSLAVKELIEAEAARLKDRVVSQMGMKSGAVEKADVGAEPDKECMKQLWAQFYKYYTGKWLAAAQKLKDQGNMEAAGKAYQKAASGFEPKKNPKEYGCLRTWAEYCIKKAGKDISVLDAV